MRALAPLLLVAACGAPGATGTATGTVPPTAASAAATPAAAATDPESVYGPLDVGADYLDASKYRRVTDEPFLSKVHGDRWVHVYVTTADGAADAYVDGNAPMPVGTVVVKASWQDEGGRPGPVPGPTYVMRKQEPGWAPDHEDWYYAIHWEKPVAKEHGEVPRAPLYWRGRSSKVDYCWACHDNYDRSLGGLVPSSILER